MELTSTPSIIGMHISGLPWIFLSADLPSSWDTGSSQMSYGGETYTASPQLALPDTLEWEEIVEPWAGIPTAPSLTIPLRMAGGNRHVSATAVGSSLAAVGDPVLAILASSPNRGALGVHVTTDITPSSTSLQLDSGSDFSSGDAYVGPETIGYTGVSSNALTGLTRGKYGSQARHHRASYTAVEETGDGGAYVSDHPLVMVGRIVTIRIAPGRVIAGSFVPDDSALDGSSSRILWRGEIRDLQLSSDMLHLELQTLGLTSLLDLEYGLHMPRHLAGDPRFYPIWVGSDNNIVRFVFDSYRIGSASDQYFQTAVGLRLQSGGSDMVDGLYSLADVFDAIRETFATEFATTGLSDWDVRPRLFHPDGDPATTMCKLHVATRDTSLTWKVTFQVVASDDSIWRELGWTSDPVEKSERDGSDYWLEIEADRELPAFCLPRESTGRKVAYSLGSGNNFCATGMVDDSGTTIKPYVLVEDEIVRVSEISSISIGDLTVHYLEIDQRGCFGSEQYSHYIPRSEATEETAQIRQVIGFPATSWMRVLLYMLRSGSGSATGTYDRLWADVGPFVDSNLLDVSGIADLATSLGDPLRDHCVIEATRIGDVIAGDLVASQCSLQTSTAGELTVTEHRQVDEVSGLTASVIDHDHIATRKGIGYELGEARIVNEIIGSNAGYDAATGQGRQTIRHHQGTSSSTWGRAQPVEIDLRGFADADSARSYLADAAQRLYAAYGRPFPILRIPITDPTRIWDAAIHDLFLFSHSALPDPLAAAIGISSAVADVIGRSVRIVDRSEDAIYGHLTLALRRAGGWRNSRLAPCARVTSISGGTVLTTDAHRFSYDSENQDALRFEAGWIIRCYRPGNELGAITRTISAVTSTSITVTSSVTMSTPFVVEFAGYAASGYDSDQYAYAHMSAGDHTLTRADSTTDRAFQYA